MEEILRCENCNSREEVGYLNMKVLCKKCQKIFKHSSQRPRVLKRIINRIQKEANCS